MLNVDLERGRALAQRVQGRSGDCQEAGGWLALGSGV